MANLPARQFLASHPNSLSTGASVADTPQHAASDNPNHPCHMQTSYNEAVTLHSAALPDLVCTAVAVCLPLHAERLSNVPVSSMLLRLSSHLHHPVGSSRQAARST